MTPTEEHPDLLLDAWLDGRLEDDERRELERHLASCPQCQALRESLVESRRALREGGRDAPLPPGLEARIRLALDTEDTRETRAAGGRGGWRLPLAVAAALALAVLGTVALLWSPRPAEGSGPVAAAFDDYERLRGAPLPAPLRVSGANELVARWRRAGLGFPVRVLDLSAMGIEVIGGAATSLGGLPAALSLYRGEDLLLVCWMFQGDEAALPAAAELHRRGGFTFHLYRKEGLTVVAWREGEVLCALAAAEPAERVLDLAFAKAMAPPLAA